MAILVVTIPTHPLLFPVPRCEQLWRDEGSNPERISHLKHLHRISSPLHLSLTQSCIPKQYREGRRASIPEHVLRMDSHRLSLKLFSDYGLWDVFIYRHHSIGQTNKEAPLWSGAVWQQGFHLQHPPSSYRSGKLFACGLSSVPRDQFYLILNYILLSTPSSPFIHVPVCSHIHIHTQFLFNWAAAIPLRRF